MPSRRKKKKKRINWQKKKATVNKHRTVEMPTETTIRIRTTIHQQEISDRKDSGISTTL